MDKQEFNCILCKRITQLRKERGFTIENLAYQSGISKGGLSEIERCKKVPMVFTILKLCAGLGITIKDFFDFQDINDVMKNL